MLNFALSLRNDGSPLGIKRERGASNLLLNAAAAPATVSGESSV
jgi:hypothetical protein